MKLIHFLHNSLLLAMLIIITGPSHKAWCSKSVQPDSLRESITFILGEDTSIEKPFFTYAAHYYHTDTVERTDYIIVTARSLLDVRNYLEQHPPRNRQPWGIINLVVHSNEWSGLSIPVHKDGSPRTTSALLNKSIQSGQFKPLPDYLIDVRTDIRIQGCASGRDLPFLELLSRAFGGSAPDEQRPLVRSSKYFISFYAVRDEKGRILECERYLTNFWYAFYPKDKNPDVTALRLQLQTRYPDVQIDWEDALTRKKPRYFGDVFHTTLFRALTLKWSVLYTDAISRPKVGTSHEQEYWLSGQSDLQDHLQEIGIPQNAFAWEIKSIKHDMADHSIVPAIKAFGRSTMLCIMQTFTEPDPINPDQLRPLKPDFDDPVYYSIVVPPHSSVR